MTKWPLPEALASYMAVSACWRRVVAVESGLDRAIPILAPILAHWPPMMT